MARLHEVREEHTDAIEEVEEAEDDLSTALNALKKVARQYGSTRGSGLIVKVTRPKSISYDADRLIELDPNILNVQGVIERTVNKTELERALQLGEADIDAANAARTEKELTSRVVVQDDPRS
jgi:hypothetical protein